MTSERIRRLREQLDQLLSETALEAIEREQSAFDEFAGPRRNRIVLFGARRLGRKILTGLRGVGIEPFAFSDNDPQTWGTIIDGVAVYSPEDAAKRFGTDAVFVITIWGRGSSDSMAQRRQNLEALGCDRVISFVPLFWKYSSTFLPHGALDLPHRVIESADQVKRCFDILSDEQSKSGLVEQVAWRVRGDFDALSDPVEDEIYFPEFVDSLQALETFVDCGAYDGDTALRFLARNDYQVKKIFAFEPDPDNFRALQENVARLPKELRERIETSRYAIGEQKVIASFAATGTVGASFAEGSFTVECISLDEALRHEAPTYIKMDIEAAEPAAIRGAKKLIKENQPVVAACSYHRQDHLWTIPLLLFETSPELAILQRQHIQKVEDLVTYGVPYGRLLDRSEH
ncbi:MAG: FkbM family methyltransferase [Bryobacteraceae bacterium]